MAKNLQFCGPNSMQFFVFLKVDGLLGILKNQIFQM